MIDHEKKKLAESVGHIVHMDGLKQMAALCHELHHRQEMCKQAMTANIDSDLLLKHLEYHNERIKKILLL